MSEPTQEAIGRRVEAALLAFQKDDCESALLNIFPALDKTAKLRYSSKFNDVGQRIKAFLTDHMPTLTFIGAGNVIRGMNFDNKTLQDAIYEFGRCALSHEGELDPRLSFCEQPIMEIGDKWVMSKSYILGLIILVIISPENKDQFFSKRYPFNFRGQSFDLSEFWGNDLPLTEAFPILNHQVVFNYKGEVYILEMAQDKILNIYCSGQAIYSPLFEEVVAAYHSSLSLDVEPDPDPKPKPDKPGRKRFRM